MKAAVFKEQNKPLVIEEIPIPEPKEGEILVKVSACGVCGTDLHYIEHGTPTFKKPPLILGHEASGIVEKGGGRLQKGDRVLIPSVLTCGSCDFCTCGRENLCKNMIMPGNHIDGAYAEFIKVPEKDILCLPDEIPLSNACIIADALSTPYHAVVNRAKVQAGHRVLVLGCGGLGINTVQIASLQGAEVIACDINDKKLEYAIEFGAKYAFNPQKIGLRDFLKQNGGFVDIAFEVVGSSNTIEEAFKSLKASGKLCIIGYTNENITINAAKIMFFEQEIIGSIGCRISDYKKIFKLVCEDKINIRGLISNRFPLEEINSAFDNIKNLKNNSTLRNIIDFNLQ